MYTSKLKIETSSVNACYLSVIVEHMQLCSVISARSSQSLWASSRHRYARQCPRLYTGFSVHEPDDWR